MLTATGADILKINRSTTAITHHHSLSLSYTLIIQCSIVIARKKNKKNSLVKISSTPVWHEICWSAILAVFARFLPFWQSLWLTVIIVSR